MVEKLVAIQEEDGEELQQMEKEIRKLSSRRI